MAELDADDKRRDLIIWSTLLALFLGALDSLVMSAAMPTIIAELGGLHLYAWTYTAYFLARAVALPIFGKLSDMYSSRILLLFSITLFLVASIADFFWQCCLGHCQSGRPDTWGLYSDLVFLALDFFHQHPAGHDFFIWDHCIFPGNP